MHILSPETDNCPSWISGRERTTVELFHDQSPRKNVADFGGDWTRDLLVSSRTAHPTEPPRPAGSDCICRQGQSLLLEAIEGICDQWRFQSDCADVQADLNLWWWHKSYCRFSVHWLIYLYLFEQAENCQTIFVWHFNGVLLEAILLFLNKVT